MKRILKIIALALFIVFIVIQFVRPDRTNPPIVEAETLEASTELPENVGKILTRSCSDCHSNKTEYPLYSEIAPASWFLAGHISEGRQKLNFSVWNTYETKKKLRKLDDICEQAKTKAMPLPSYLWIHWSAKPTDEEIKVLCGWTQSESRRLAKAE